MSVDLMCTSMYSGGIGNNIRYTKEKSSLLLLTSPKVKSLLTTHSLLSAQLAHTIAVSATTKAGICDARLA